ncbi:hypothetical protein NE237_023887 [Protea cynaroides]|uniref:Magnesium-dependent phosphatase 1 n=1 Tax=Protea cynaroides TaxID=273540 RepID=A0A9Q0K6U3_9MAGN|nr:hypothetical protein NE237_023887 [Protea cynaroides]
MPYSRRLSSHFSALGRPNRAARQLPSISDISPRPSRRMEEASSTKSIGGSLSPKEALAWELFSPIHRILIVAVVAVAAADLQKSRLIWQLTKSLELRDFAPKLLQLPMWDLQRRLRRVQENIGRRSLRIERTRGREETTTTMGDEKIKDEALKILGVFQVLPRLVVFDLDYTLWPFYCECRSKREMPSLYPQAKGILYALKDKGVDIAIASRSPTPDIAKTFLDKLGMQSMFVAQEIFSSWTHKTEHFQRIHRRTGVPFNSMLFFDDEDRNIEAVSKMGVTSILVGNGVNLGALRQGLTMFTQNSAPSERNNQK